MLSKSLRWWAVTVLWFGACGAALAADPKAEALRFTGRVEPAEQTGMYARVAGAIDKVDVDIGDRVKKGQVLIELSAPELKDDLDLASARVAQAKAEVEQADATAQAAKAQTGQADATLEAAKAVVRRGKAAAEQAQADADRVRKLGDNNAVSREEIEARTRQADAARAAVEEAEAQLGASAAAREAAAAEFIRAQAGVMAARAGVEIAEAGVRRAQTQLGYLKITAPFDGVVARRLADSGAVVGPARPGDMAPLLTVMRDDVVHLVFDVDERGAAKVAVGTAVVVHAPGLPDAEFAGKVTRTAGVVNPDTGTMRTQIDLANPDGRLRPGMSVIVELKSDGTGK